MRVCVDLPERTLERATVRVLFIFGCVGVRAPMPVCARVCACVCVCTRVRVATCVGGCVHAREPALVRAFVHMRARVCVFDRLALLFPWQARAREVAAKVGARP